MSDDEEKPSKVEKEVEKSESVEKVDELEVTQKVDDDSQEIIEESAKKVEESKRARGAEIETQTQISDDNFDKVEEPLWDDWNYYENGKPIIWNGWDVEEEKRLLGGGPSDYSEESIKKVEESKRAGGAEIETQTQISDDNFDEVEKPPLWDDYWNIDQNGKLKGWDIEEEKGLLGGGPSDYSDEESPESGENDEGEGEEGEEDEGEVSHMFKKTKDLNEKTKRKREITSACSRASAASTNKKKAAEEEKKLSEKRASRPDDPNNPAWLKGYEKHRERVSTAVSKLDTRCPVVNKNKYTSPTTFNNSLREFTRIEKENAVLLHRIANIFSGNGKVDCHLEGKKRYINNEVAVRRNQLLNITFENLALARKIQEVRSSYERNEQLKEFAKNEEVMQKNAYFPLHWKVRKPYIWDDLEERVLNNACLNPRPRVFMDIRIGKIGDYLGRIVMELRADIVPFTVENFRTLCTSRKFGFDCCTFYRIYPGLFWQGGEKITDRQTHKERKSLYGDFFPDENFKLRHDRPGTISMANEGRPNSNGSHFIITACSLPPLDDKNVVFGHIVAGMGVLKEMNKFAGMCINSGEPNRRIWVSATGELFPGADVSEFQDSEDDILEDSEEEDETPRKKSGRGRPKNTPRPKIKVIKKGTLKDSTDESSDDSSEQPDMKEEILDPETSIMIFPNSERSIVKEQTGASRSRPRPSSSTIKKAKK